MMAFQTAEKIWYIHELRHTKCHSTICEHVQGVNTRISQIKPKYQHLGILSSVTAVIPKRRCAVTEEASRELSVNTRKLQEASSGRAGVSAGHFAAVNNGIKQTTGCKLVAQQSVHEEGISFANQIIDTWPL